MWKCGHGKRSILFIVITEESSLELVKRLGLDQMDAVEDYLCHIAPIGAVCKHGSFGSIHTRARKPYIVSFSAPYPDAVNAANPYGFHREDLPSVIDSFLSAWAYKKSHPAFEVVNLETRSPRASRHRSSPTALNGLNRLTTRCFRSRGHGARPALESPKTTDVFRGKDKVAEKPHGVLAQAIGRTFQNRSISSIGTTPCTKRITRYSERRLARWNFSTFVSVCDSRPISSS